MLPFVSFTHCISTSQQASTASAHPNLRDGKHDSAPVLSLDDAPVLSSLDSPDVMPVLSLLVAATLVSPDVTPVLSLLVAATLVSVAFALSSEPEDPLLSDEPEPLAGIVSEKHPSTSTRASTPASPVAFVRMLLRLPIPCPRFRSRASPWAGKELARWSG